MTFTEIDTQKKLVAKQKRTNKKLQKAQDKLTKFNDKADKALHKRDRLSAKLSSIAEALLEYEDGEQLETAPVPAKKQAKRAS